MEPLSYEGDMFGTKISDLMDDRPHISFANNKEVKDSLVKENEQINIIKKENKETKTILDEKLGDILQKTTDTISNFWDDYKVKMLESKYELENNKEITEEDKEKLSHIINIHSKGLFNYLRDNDNIIYLGIFFIFISVLIYIFNIIR